MGESLAPVKQDYDVLVVGFGKAGKTIAMKRAKAGDRVALVEKDSKMYGGTCINVGCVPTKKLIVESQLWATFGTEPDSGLFTGQARRDGLIDKMNAANLAMAENAGVTVITGTAKFTGPKTVLVTGGEDQLELTAETIIINTGSTPVWPDLPGINGEHVYDSTGIQHIRRPESLVVVGGGPIGLEFANMFANYGTKVTVLDASDRALSRFDSDVADMAVDILKDKGVRIRTNVRVEGFANSKLGVNVKFNGGEVFGDACLVAIGRRPNTDGLNLEAVGIELTERGAVKVDEFCQTTVPGVYAAGDVNGGPQFTYISFDDHRVIMSHRWGVGKQRSTAGRIIPTTTFIEPPLSTVGVGIGDVTTDEAEIRSVKIADVPILPRPKIVGKPEGMARLIVSKEDGTILGATLFCIDSQELINTVAVAMRTGMTADELAEGIYTHPATSEVFNALT